MKQTKLVAAAAVLAVGGAVVIQTAGARSTNVDLSLCTTPIEITSTAGDLLNCLCGDASVQFLSDVEQDPLGCPAAQ